jgi:hypothetical protein
MTQTNKKTQSQTKTLFDVSKVKMDEDQKEKIASLSLSLSHILDKFNCHYQYTPKYTKAKELLPCIVDERKAIWSMICKEKKLFETNIIPICQIDKENFQFSCCSNDFIPFHLAPCQYMKKKTVCSEYVTSLNDVALDGVSEKDNLLLNHAQNSVCLNYQKNVYDQPKANAKCFVCNREAKASFGLTDKKGIESIYNVCDRHKKFNACKCSPFKLAICDLFADQKDCVLFEDLT